MKCNYCGFEIGENDRFCSGCGRENAPAAQTMPPLQRPDRPAPPQNYPQPRPAAPQPKKSGAGKWIFAGAWLALAVIGWILALVLTTGSSHVPATVTPSAYRVSGFQGLTEGQWYQWDLDSRTMYCWRFSPNGTAEYSPAGQDGWQTVDYVLAEDSGSVIIGYVGDHMIWEYDPQEHCFWQSTVVDGDVCRVRILPASGVPEGASWGYRYRGDNGVAQIPAYFENISVLTRETAQTLLDSYNTYLGYGVCRTGEPDTKQEGQAALQAAGLNPDIYRAGKVPCCHSLEQMRQHLEHQFGDELIYGGNFSETKPMEIDGKLYYFVAPMGYGVYTMSGEPAQQADGSYTVPVTMGMEGDAYPFTARFEKDNGTWKLTAVYEADTEQTP